MPVCDLAISKRANAGVAQQAEATVLATTQCKFKSCPRHRADWGIRSEQNPCPLGQVPLAQRLERPLKGDMRGFDPRKAHDAPHD